MEGIENLLINRMEKISLQTIRRETRVAKPPVESDKIYCY
jgi:hypothetical protein